MNKREIGPRLNRRAFLELLAAASAAGMGLYGRNAPAAGGSRDLYDLPPSGNVSLLHFTDCHAQLLPTYFREPQVNLGVGASAGKPPHLVGEHLLRHYGIHPGTRWAHALTHLDFTAAARTYGKVGGFAHLATLVKTLRSQRPGCLLLDGGDTWQGSATALWSNGQDMVDACKLLGVDVMTGHWEFTLGAARVQEIIARDLKGKIEFLAQNVSTSEFGDTVFPAYSLRSVNGVLLGIIGQAYPYTPIANPRYKIPGWTFGIQEETLRNNIAQVRRKGAQLVVLLSHNGVDLDLKLASRVAGIDIILGGHTHDALPVPLVVTNSGGKTIVSNAGCNGKFLAVFDLDINGTTLKDYRYHLLPVFSNLLAPDPAMQSLIDRHRAPYARRLGKKLAETDTLLYRRGNLTGTFDQLILDAMLTVMDCEAALSPGFRWGTAVLPGDSITLEDVMNQTAITYPAATTVEMTGKEIKNVLEDVADNLFNPDPYYCQGGDMVRVGGVHYTLSPNERIGGRIGSLTLRGKPLRAERKYKVATWAPLAPDAAGAPIWEVVTAYLRDKKAVTAVAPNVPRLIGVRGNSGLG